MTVVCPRPPSTTTSTTSQRTMEGRRSIGNGIRATGNKSNDNVGRQGGECSSEQGRRRRRNHHDRRKRQSNNNNNQPTLKQRYEAGDPEVGLLGEASARGNFEYYVLYSRPKSDDDGLEAISPSGWGD